MTSLADRLREMERGDLHRFWMLRPEVCAVVAAADAFEREYQRHRGAVVSAEEIDLLDRLQVKYLRASDALARRMDEEGH